MQSPRILSLGGGLDSWVMLLESVARGEAPDLVVFIDVGAPGDPGEWPSTYRHVDEVVRPFCAKHGIEFVRIDHESYPVRDARSLFAWLEARNQIPVAGPNRICTRIAKVERFEAWMDDRFPGREVEIWIGFEAGEEARAEKDPNAGTKRKPKPGTAVRRNRFPLIEWGLCRCRCETIARESGHPVPRKSACVFCPYGAKGDWQRFAVDLPDDFERVVQLEANKPPTKKNNRKLSIMAYDSWEAGRESKRPAGELIRTADFEVSAIAAAADARAFVELHHYSRTCSALAYRFGLYRRGELVGVAAFGPPASTNAHRAVFPTLAFDEAVTLGRFVLLDAVPGNGESWFIARCFDLLRARGVKAVESCADPEARVALDGCVRHKGHVGTIYQSTNGRYVGLTNAATLRLLPDGTCLSNRAQGKLARGERGAAGPARQLEAWGADPIGERSGEDALAWLRTWRERLTRPMRHRGNHRYLWCLDRRLRKQVLTRAALSYPKVSL